MPRWIKALGLMPIAILVMVAANPAVSQAAKFKTEVVGVNLEGASEGNVALQFAYGKTECKANTFAGKMAVKESLLMILDPTYGSCTTAGLSTSVDMKTCDHEFVSVEKEGAGFLGGVNFHCTEKDEITLTVSASGITKCTITIPGQVHLETVAVKNVGAGTTREVTMEAAVAGLTYTQKEGTGLGKCSAAHNTTGTYSGKLLVKAKSQETNAHVGLWVE